MTLTRRSWLGSVVTGLAGLTVSLPSFTKKRHAWETPSVKALPTTIRTPPASTAPRFYVERESIDVTTHGDTHEKYISGIRRYTIDGQQVSREHFMREFHKHTRSQR